MKKIVPFALLMMLFSPVYSQKEYSNHFLGAKSEDAAHAMADKMVTAGPNVYKFDRILENTGLYSKYSLCYKEVKEENPQELYIEYTILVIGANRDKGIEGDSFYIISKMNGEGDEILPIWRKYFDKEASEEHVKMFTQHEVIVNVQGIIYQYILSIEPTQWIITGALH